MVSKAKLYMQLDQLEAELFRRILPQLEQAAQGENDLVFCAADFTTLAELKGKTDKETEALIDIGARILVLKDKLGECSKGSIAEKICWYCREWADKEKHNRKSTQILAAQFLSDIKSGSLA